MKKLLMAVIMMASISIAQAQTKGTNTIGLGVGFQSQKTEVNGQGITQTNEQKNQFFSLGYGSFVKDNERIGIDFSYGKSDYSADQSGRISTQKNYGGNISYQKYIPLLKKFYAFGGGRGGYQYSKSVFDNTPNQVVSSNSYSVGGYGGLTWFLSKRFAFETDLLSANITYSKTENQNTDFGNNYNYKSTGTNFNVSTAGAINNLGFKIYLLF
jgi:hypothetical protein